MVEDASAGVVWSVDDRGAVTYTLPDPVLPPWSASEHRLTPVTRLVVVPRVHVTGDDVSLLQSRQAEGVQAALLVPDDVPLPELGVPVLRCPDRLDDLDRMIEDKLLTSRITRA